MATAIAVGSRPATRATGTRPIGRLLIDWILIVPVTFFAVGGVFSFEQGNTAGNGSSLAGLASSGRQLGLVGRIIFPGIVYSIVLWLLLTNLNRIISIGLQMKTITALALLTLASTLWSQDPFRSAYNAGFYLIGTLFAFYLVSKFRPRELAWIMMAVGSLLAILGLIIVAFFPQYGVLHSHAYLAWQGAIGDRSGAAKVLVFLLSPALTLRGRLSSRHILYIATMLLMIYMAHAMTARVVLFVYVILVALTRILGRFGSRSRLVAGIAFLAVAAMVVCILISLTPLILHGMGKDATLSGRTGIWAVVIREIAKRPLLGYGYYAFWEGLKGESANLVVGSHWVFSYAHNGLLEIGLQLGFLGMAVFLVTLVQAVRNAWYCLRNGCPPGVEWYIGLIGLTVMYNIDESTVLWPIDLNSILYLVACCGLAIAARQIKARGAMEALYS